LSSAEPIFIGNKTIEKVSEEELARLKSRLTTGVGKDFVSNASEALRGSPDAVDEVVLWCSEPPPLSRKAAWLLHNVALVEPGAILRREAELVRIFDDSDDPSIHREIFRCLLAVPHSSEIAAYLLELALLIPHDPSQPIAMRHLALRVLDHHVERVFQEGLTPSDSLLQALEVLHQDASHVCRNHAKRLLEKLG
jgi:hypothetical protein